MHLPALRDGLKLLRDHRAHRRVDDIVQTVSARACSGTSMRTKHGHDVLEVHVAQHVIGGLTVDEGIARVLMGDATARLSSQERPASSTTTSRRSIITCPATRVGVIEQRSMTAGAGSPASAGERAAVPLENVASRPRRPAASEQAQDQPGSGESCSCMLRVGSAVPRSAPGPESAVYTRGSAAASFIWDNLVGNSGAPVEAMQVLAVRV